VAVGQRDVAKQRRHWFDRRRPLFGLRLSHGRRRARERETLGKKHEAIVGYLGAAAKKMGDVHILPWWQVIKELS
jgi:hypothetical protein